MDNDVLELLRETIEKECKLELVPPQCHIQNVANVTIKKFKAQCIAILACLPASFSIRLGCELLIQAELTLNILQSSHIRSGVSTQA